MARAQILAGAVLGLGERERSGDRERDTGRLPEPKSANSKPSAIVPLAKAAREASVRPPVAMIVASGCPPPSCAQNAAMV